MECAKITERKLGLTEASIWAIGNRINPVERESSFTLMAIFMKVCDFFFHYFYFQYIYKFFFYLVVRKIFDFFKHSIFYF